MNTPESISAETKTQFPIGSLVRLSEKGRKFTPYRWWNRKGKVVGYEVRWTKQPYQSAKPTQSILLVVWRGRTRRRISRRHRSDFTALNPSNAKRNEDATNAGGKT